MRRKIVGIFVCFILIGTAITVSGDIETKEITFDNDGTLSGYVNDSSMNPIEGALVLVHFHGTYEEDYTDSLGYYHVSNIPICWCMKNSTASKPGYKGEWILLAIDENTTHDFILSPSNVLYVGGSGPGNYSKIQDAIDNATDSDTVFVYDDSSPYCENLKVDKSITLQGENKETTIIDGNNSEIVVNISSDNVILSGFTVYNHGNHSPLTSIIFVQSNYNVISGNIIKAYEDYGINIAYTEYTTISDNTFSGNDTSESWMAIFIYEGKNNNISRNTIKNFKGGITYAYSNNYSIYKNTFMDNTFAINPAGFSINDVISRNNISNSFYGIYALNCFNYKIIKNNFIGNKYRNAGFGYYLCELLVFGSKYKSIRDIRSTIKWDGNYWGRSRIFPKFIIGEIPPGGILRWFHIDWNPVSKPIDIGV